MYNRKVQDYTYTWYLLGVSTYLYNQYFNPSRPSKKKCIINKLQKEYILSSIMLPQISNNVLLSHRKNSFNLWEIGKWKWEIGTPCFNLLHVGDYFAADSLIETCFGSKIHSSIHFSTYFLKYSFWGVPIRHWMLI